MSPLPLSNTSHAQCHPNPRRTLNYSWSYPIQKYHTDCMHAKLAGQQSPPRMCFTIDIWDVTCHKGNVPTLRKHTTTVTPQSLETAYTKNCSSMAFKRLSQHHKIWKQHTLKTAVQWRSKGYHNIWHTKYSTLVPRLISSLHALHEKEPEYKAEGTEGGGSGSLQWNIDAESGEQIPKYVALYCCWNGATICKAMVSKHLYCCWNGATICKAMVSIHLEKRLTQ